MGPFRSGMEIGGTDMKTDLQKELESALKKKEMLRDEYARVDGVISFLQYLIENEKKEEEVKG